MRDFGSILESWESAQGRRQDMQGYQKDRILNKNILPVPGEGRQKLKRMAAERTLDLHGYTVQEALRELERFLLQARQDHLKKVLIIHGKGKHSDGSSVLQKAVREYLEFSRITGETGIPKRQDGGDGATWAVIRYRSR